MGYQNRVMKSTEKRIDLRRGALAVAMLPLAGGGFEASLLSQASQALPGQSRLRRGQFRLRRAKKQLAIDRC